MKLRIISEDFDGKGNWEDYVKSNGYVISDLDILYHGTSLDLLPSIMKFGLDPANSNHVEDEIDIADSYDDLGPPFHFVYLSHHRSMSAEFAPGGDYTDSDKNKAVILSVRLPLNLKSD
jgi:hypothetical protein